MVGWLVPANGSHNFSEQESKNNCLVMTLVDIRSSFVVLILSKFGQASHGSPRGGSGIGCGASDCANRDGVRGRRVALNYA
jgi:hypothetical protein